MEIAVEIWWPCMVCGRWRPDGLIGVAPRKVVLSTPTAPTAPPTPPVTVISPFRVRYCLDEAACVTAATAPGPWRGWTEQARRTMNAGVTGVPSPP